MLRTKHASWKTISAEVRYKAHRLTSIIATRGKRKQIDGELTAAKNILKREMKARPAAAGFASLPGRSSR
jgi:hypothetical protein